MHMINRIGQNDDRDNTQISQVENHKHGYGIGNAPKPASLIAARDGWFVIYEVMRQLGNFWLNYVAS